MAPSAAHHPTGGASARCDRSMSTGARRYPSRDVALDTEPPDERRLDLCGEARQPREHERGARADRRLLRGEEPHDCFGELFDRRLDRARRSDVSAIESIERQPASEMEAMIAGSHVTQQREKLRELRLERAGALQALSDDRNDRERGVEKRRPVASTDRDHAPMQILDRARSDTRVRVVEPREEHGDLAAGTRPVGCVE